jgi:preprotein translocase subunit SecD
MEPDDVRTEGDAVASFHVVGLRTFLLTGEPVITTKDVDAADATQDPQTLGADVRVSLGPDGADRFYGFTQEWVGRRLAIVIDDHIESAPVVRGPIRGGKISITMGVGAPDEQLANARRLAASLR